MPLHSKALTSAAAILLALSLAGCGSSNSDSADSEQKADPIASLFADDYGTRDYEIYTLGTTDDETAPTLTVVPPDWVIGVAPDQASEDDPSHGMDHLTCTFENGNFYYTYVADDARSYVEYYVSEDTIITDHLFGGRFTEIELGPITTEEIGGHEVLWGSYTYKDEYDRPNCAYVAACDVRDGIVITLTATESIPRDAAADATFFLDGARFREIWEALSW